QEMRKLQVHRTEFVANVSHELKTPLTAIQGFSETLIKDKEMSLEQQKKFLEIIWKHSSRLGATVSDLLTLSQIEQGEPESLDLKEFSVQEFFSQLKDTYEYLADQKKIKLSFHSKSLFSLYGNFSLLEHAVGNLIENAIKYSHPEKSISITCEK